MGLVTQRIDELEGTAIEQPDGLTAPEPVHLTYLYAAWHGDTRNLAATRRDQLLEDA